MAAEFLAQDLVTTLLAIMAFIVVVLNLLCIIVFLISPGLWEPSSSFIFNLILVHLFQGALVIPSYTCKRLRIGSRVQRGIVCDTFRFSYLVTNYVLCLTLLAITVERLITILLPLRSKSILTKRTVFLTLMFIWIYVLVLCLVPFMSSVGEHSLCSYKPMAAWTASMLLINTALPQFFIAVCYIKIFWITRRAHKREMKGFTSSQERAKIWRRREVQVAITAFAAVVAFAICWAPSFWYYLLRSVCPSCFTSDFSGSRKERILTLVMKMITFLDGIIAPILYCFKYIKFQIALRRLLRGKRFCLC